MTATQKLVVELLLQGHDIEMYRNGPSRVRNENNEVVKVVNTRTVSAIRSLLRKEKSGLLVIDKNKVRQLNGNCIAKKMYKALSNGK